MRLASRVTPGGRCVSEKLGEARKAKRLLTSAMMSKAVEGYRRRWSALMKRMPCSSIASGVGVSVVFTHSFTSSFLQMEIVSHAFEPVLEEEGLAAPCNHAATMEVHKSWYESLLRFWWYIQIEFYVERADTRVSNCFHVL